MEYILKNNFSQMQRNILVYIVTAAMLFGVMNPSVYVEDRDTAKVINGMGEMANFEATVFPVEKVNFSEFVSGKQILKTEMNSVKKVLLNSYFMDFHNVYDKAIASISSGISIQSDIKDNRSIISDTTGNEKIKETMKIDTDNVLEDTVCNPVSADISEIITIPSKDDIPEVIPDRTDNPAGGKVSDDLKCIEIQGMKVDEEGYVTEVTGGVSDGLFVFPTDTLCKGVRVDAFANMEDSLKNEVTEIWIPANITQIETGAFDCLKNVNFIETEAENPVYYSEAGILYHTDGSVACMPQRRIR